MLKLWNLTLQCLAIEHSVERAHDHREMDRAPALLAPRVLTGRSRSPEHPKSAPRGAEPAREPGPWWERVSVATAVKPAVPVPARTRGEHTSRAGWPAQPAVRTRALRATRSASAV